MKVNLPINLKKPLLVAEIGINHNGSLNIAKKMIDLAKKYEFDLVKFQKRSPEISTPELQKNIMRETPWGLISYINYKKKIEFGLREYKEIDNYCKRINIGWFASAFDIESQKFMKKFNTKYNKIASAMITNKKFIEFVSKEKKTTFISTGMCEMKDIIYAVNIFKKNKCPFILMHCVSTYPCKDENLNLAMISELKKKFACKIGYSGHEATTSPSLVAWMLGAEAIERHITLDRSMWGTDQAASLSEDGIRMLTGLIKKTPTLMGKGEKIFSKEEKKLSKKFRYWE